MLSQLIDVMNQPEAFEIVWRDGEIFIAPRAADQPSAG